MLTTSQSINRASYMTPRDPEDIFLSLSMIRTEKPSILEYKWLAFVADEDRGYKRRAIVLSAQVARWLPQAVECYVRWMNWPTFKRN